MSPLKKLVLFIGVVNTFGVATAQSSPGVCGNRICPDIFDPVCVRYNSSYIPFENSCQALNCGYTFWLNGTCPFSTVPTRPPCACPRNIQEVCGTDGRTYVNPCMANCNGITNYTMGSCDNDTVVHIQCSGQDGHRYSIQSAIDGVSRSRYGNWSFTVLDNGTYTISSCPSDVDTQLSIDNGPFQDNDVCGGNGEIINVAWSANTVHSISIRPWSSGATGTVRVNISSPTVCPVYTGPVEPPSELICGDQVTGVIHPYTNFTIPFSVTPSMLNTNVVVNSCGSNFDTVIRIYQNGQQIDYNDDNRYYCRNASAAVAIEGSLIVNRSVGDYVAVLGGFGAASGTYALSLECGGDPAEDPCNKCPSGTYCYSANPNNETCRNWYFTHPGQAVPRSCRGCFGRSDGCIRQHLNCSGEYYCAMDVPSSQVEACCNSSRPTPDSCYRCASRLNPPTYCPVRTQTRPTSTTRPGYTTTPIIHESCGPLEVYDEQSCDKFCADSPKQGGLSKQAIWTRPSTSTLGECCCLNSNGTKDERYCCIDNDIRTNAPAVQCSLFSTCGRVTLDISKNTNVTNAVTEQNGLCDWTAVPGSSEHEACHAVEDAVQLATGSLFYTCCPCMKTLADTLGGAFTFISALDCKA